MTSLPVLNVMTKLSNKYNFAYSSFKKKKDTLSLIIMGKDKIKKRSSGGYRQYTVALCDIM